MEKLEDRSLLAASFVLPVGADLDIQSVAPDEGSGEFVLSGNRTVNNVLKAGFRSVDVNAQSVDAVTNLDSPFGADNRTTVTQVISDATGNVQTFFGGSLDDNGVPQTVVWDSALAATALVPPDAATGGSVPLDAVDGYGLLATTTSYVVSLADGSSMVIDAGAGFMSSIGNGGELVGGTDGGFPGIWRKGEDGTYSAEALTLPAGVTLTDPSITDFTNSNFVIADGTTIGVGDASVAGNPVTIVGTDVFDTSAALLSDSVQYQDELLVTWMGDTETMVSVNGGAGQSFYDYINQHVDLNAAGVQSFTGAPILSTHANRLGAIVDGQTTGGADETFFVFVEQRAAIKSVGGRSVDGGPTKVTSAAPVIEWNAVAQADYYEIWGDNRTTGERRAIFETNLTSTSYTPPEDLPLSDFRIWMRAVAGGIGGPWSPPVNAQIRTAAVVTGPAEQIDETSPTITWDDVAGANVYDVWLDSRSSGQSQLIRTTTQHTSLPVGLNLTIGRYRVWVRPENSTTGIRGEWSNPLDFEVAIPAELQRPTGRISNPNPNVAWTDVFGAVKYDIWVNNQSTGESQIYRNRDVDGTNITIPTDLPMGRYRTWVRPINAQGEAGPWSRVRAFDNVAATTLLAPTGVTPDRTPTISWEELPGADEYEIWIDGAGQTEFLRVEGIQGTSYTPTSPLPESDYRVWVRGRTGDGLLGNWSQPMDFAVAVTPIVTHPTGELDEDGRPIVTVPRPEIQWTALEDVERYDLWVARVDEFGNPITSPLIRNQDLTGTSFTPGADLTDGFYRVWVRATFTDGIVTRWSPIYDFRVDLAGTTSSGDTPPPGVARFTNATDDLFGDVDLLGSL